MNDLPPDLPRLRTLETWLVLTLDRVRHKYVPELTAGLDSLVTGTGPQRQP
ncbi:hypothetical protein [Streptomyces sp. NPDC058424]|uniref:hypothetical protein n=1 Tax=Streptomyces sp. NPDC058424 TaxID=3346491 RepID=UPI003646BC8E